LRRLFSRAVKKPAAVIRFSDGKAHINPDDLLAGAMEFLGVDGPRLLDSEAASCNFTLVMIKTPVHFGNNLARYC